MNTRNTKKPSQSDDYFPTLAPTPVNSMQRPVYNSPIKKPAKGIKFKIACAVVAALVMLLFVLAATVRFEEYIEVINITQAPEPILIGYSPIEPPVYPDPIEDCEWADTLDELHVQYREYWLRHGRLTLLAQSVEQDENLFDGSVAEYEYYSNRFEQYIYNRDALIAGMLAEQNSDVLTRQNLQTQRATIQRSLNEAWELYNQQDLILQSITTGTNVVLPGDFDLSYYELIALIIGGGLGMGMDLGPFARFIPENITSQNYREVILRLRYTIPNVEQLILEQTLYLMESNLQLQRRISMMETQIADINRQLNAIEPIIIDVGAIKEQLRLEKLIIVSNEQSAARQMLDYLQMEIEYISMLQNEERSRQLQEEEQITPPIGIGNGSQLLVEIDARDWGRVEIGQEIRANIPTGSGYAQGEVTETAVNVNAQNVPIFTATAILHGDYSDVTPESVSDVRIIVGERTLLGRLVGGN